MTVVGSTSVLPGNCASAAVRADTTDPDLASAAKFEDALAQTSKRSSPAVTASPEVTSESFAMDPQALTAADDAWVRFLAISEQLQNPELTAAAKDSLLKDLTNNWRSFRSQSDPIARQVEDYIASQAATPADGPAHDLSS